MLVHVMAILGVVVLCIVWALLQSRAAKNNPEGGVLEGRCGSCDCGSECPEENPDIPGSTV